MALAGRLLWARRRWRRLSRETLQLHRVGGEKLWKMGREQRGRQQQAEREAAFRTAAGAGS